MTRMTARARRILWRTSIVAACCSSVLAACTGTTDPVTANGIAELTAPATTVNVGQGFSTKSIIAIRRGGTFEGVVQLSAHGLPQGLLVSFAPASLSNGATLSEMTISALSTIAPGAHSFTVTASAEGYEGKSTTVSIMVTVPAIAVATTTTTANVAQGSTQVIPITITRGGGFTGIVGLSLLGLPTGVTATFAPPAIESGATTSTLTISAPLTAQLGAKTVTLRASAQGLADKTIPIELTVGPATTHAVLVSATPVLMTVTGGQTVETTLTLQRFAGFNGAVTVTVDGLPPQLTASADPFAAGSNTTTLRISGKVEEFGVGYNPPATPYQMSVRANGQGIQQASVGIAVGTVFMPQFNLFFDPPSQGAPSPTSRAVTINRGESATARLRIHRYQYAHAITLSVTGLPANVTTNVPATIPASVPEQEIVVVVTVGADAVPGVYDIVIRGESVTPLVRQATIVLTVN